jgi:hypothetical protein
MTFSVKVSLKYFLFLSSLTFINLCKSQASVENVIELAKIKDATTYVIVADTSDPENKAIVDAISRAWTLSKLSFIYRDDLKTYAKEGTYFISLEMLETQDKSLTYPGTATTEVRYITKIKDPALMLWHPKMHKDWFEKKEDIHIQLAENPFEFLDRQPAEIGNSDMYYNMSPGLIYNHIQYLHLLIRTQKTMKPGEDILNANQIQKLKRDTLFIPKYILKGGRVASQSGTPPNVEITYERVKVKASSIFGDYPYKYKTISDSALSERILQGASFYYVTYFTQLYFTFVSVTNSKTGEIIYSYSKRGVFPDEDGVYHMTPKNVKRLQDAIEEGK